MSATVREAALTFDAVSDPGLRPAAGLIGQGIEEVRIGYARDLVASDPASDRGVLCALDDAASTLSMLGARIGLIDLPEYPIFGAAAGLILGAEALVSDRDRIAAHNSLYGPPGLVSLLRAIGLGPDDVAAAREVTLRLGAALAAQVVRFDALLTANTLAPAPAVAAFRGGRTVWMAMRTLPFNATGDKAISVPAGFVDGLPVGLQLIARHEAEDMLVSIGDGLEHVAQKWEPVLRSANVRDQQVRAYRVTSNQRDMLSSGRRTIRSSARREFPGGPACGPAAVGWPADALPALPMRPAGLRVGRRRACPLRSAIDESRP